VRTDFLPDKDRQKAEDALREQLKVGRGGVWCGWQWRAAVVGGLVGGEVVMVRAD
jgi:hypothetical protein